MKFLNSFCRSKVLTLSLASAVVTVWLAGCAGSSKDGQSTQPHSTNAKTVQYTCSMHPEVVQDKPGDCPKCGMKLVAKP